MIALIIPDQGCELTFVCRFIENDGFDLVSVIKELNEECKNAKYRVWIKNIFSDPTSQSRIRDSFMKRWDEIRKIGDQHKCYKEFEEELNGISIEIENND